MIVISGALVLVALVLLVLGLTMTDLQFVYGSIAVSLVSFVFLVIGILQRRGEQPAAATAELSDDAAGPVAVAAGAPETAAVPAAAAAKTGSPGPVPVVEDELGEGEPGGGTVLVVPGRPRYHVEGCRYLTGKDAEQIDVLDARDDGFTPCGVCKPDSALEARAAEELDEGQVDEGEFAESQFDEEPADEIAEPEPVAARSGRGAATRTRGGATAALAAPAAPARKAATKRAPSPRVGSAAVPEAASPRRPAKVVVIPERGRFHTPQCRFVREALGTEELTRAQATRQGYQPCGVCRP